MGERRSQPRVIVHRSTSFIAGAPVSVDAATRHLLLIDLQRPGINMIGTVLPDSLLRAAAALRNAARLLGWPITYTVTGDRASPGKLAGELAKQARAHEKLVTRTTTSAFLNESIVGEIAGAGCNTLVIAGAPLEGSVIHTALDAIERGYTIVVPVEAVGSASARVEAAALRELERAGATVTSLRTLLLRYAPDDATTLGTAVRTCLATVLD